MNALMRFKFNIIYIAVLFIWPILGSLYFKIDGAGRVQAIMTILAILVNGRHLLKVPKIMLVWFVWCIYSILNMWLKGYQMIDNSFPLWIIVHIFCPLVSMLVVYNSCTYNYKAFIKYLFLFCLFFVFFGALNMSESKDYSGRTENLLGNSFLNISIMLMPFMLLYVKDKKLPIIIVVMVTVFLLGVLVMSGQRKSLLSVLIIIAGMVYYLSSKNGSRNAIWAIIVVCFIAYSSLLYLMENTVAGDRFSQQLEETSTYDDSFFLKMMGDRAYMYVAGVEIFLNEPWTGIGLTNFLNHSSNISGLMFHTEYMVELAECGIVGTVLFLSFYIGMFVCILRILRTNIARYEGIVLGSVLLAIVFMNFTAWTYDYSQYFMFYGLLFATYTNVIDKNAIQKKRVLKTDRQ